MQTILMTDKNGDHWIMTTEHTASSYGRAIVVGPDGTAYGPADRLCEMTTCEEIVANFRAGRPAPDRLSWGRRTANALKLAETIAPSHGRRRYIGPKKQISMQVPADLYDDYAAAAKSAGMSMPAYLEHLLRSDHDAQSNKSS